MTTYQANNKRIAKNTMFLYIRMFFVLLANLYISRILLDTLGVVDYGIYMVVAGLVSLFGFFNTTLASTLQRYYNYEDTHKREQGIQDIFATGCIINLLVAVLTFILLESVGLWYFNHYLVVPANRMEAATILFHASTLSLVLIILQIPATGLILAKERMGFYAAGSMIDISLKVAAAMALPYIGGEHISVYAYFLLGIAIFDFLLYHGYAKLSFRYIHLSRKINRQTARSLLAFTGWNMMGTLAFMLRGQGISLLLNNFFGPIVNAARGISMQVSSAVGQFSSNVSIAFAPQISNSVAAQDHRRAQYLMFTESKICYALMLILATPLCLEIDYILNLWLGHHIPSNTNIFCVLMLIDALICTLNTPCTQITLATGKIKLYEIVSTTINLCLIPVCYIFLKIGYGAVSSFVITIVFSIILQTACLIITHQQFNFKYINYLKEVLFPCLGMTFLLPVIPTLIKINMHTSFLRLTVVCVMALLTCIPMVYCILLNQKEKIWAKTYVLKWIQRNHNNSMNL